VLIGQYITDFTIFSQFVNMIVILLISILNYCMIQLEVIGKLGKNQKLPFIAPLILTGIIPILSFPLYIYDFSHCRLINKRISLGYVFNIFYLSFFFILLSGLSLCVLCLRCQDFFTDIKQKS